MSNSPLVSYTRISPNKTSPRKHKIDTITIHCFVGQVTAERGADVFAPTSRQASCNYVIGKDGRIALVVDEGDRSWCTGGYDKNGNPIRVNGISGADNDQRAITIECASDSTHPYAINSKVYESLVKLCADICKRNGIEELRWQGDKNLVGQVHLQNMTVHRWFANKACPGDYIYNRLGQIAKEVNAILENERKISLKSEEETDMDLAQFKKLWHEMRDELQDNDHGTWSKDAIDWAVDNGIIKGSSETEFNGMYEDVLTREQMLVILYRFAKLIGKA